MAVILLDTFANMLCIAMMLRICGRRASALRVLLAALVGAIPAQGVRMLDFSRGQAAVLSLLLAEMTAAAAFGRFSLKNAAVLLACGGFLGGTIYALSQAAGSKAAAWSVGVAFALLLSRSAIRVRRAACDVHTVRIRITCAHGEAEFDALVDSGNCLRDYLTHRPVIVLPESARERLGLCGVLLRPIFADTAGGRQMMDCFTPRGVRVIKGKGEREVSACAAFSTGLPDGAPALVPLSLLADDEDESIGYREGKAYGEAEG